MIRLRSFRFLPIVVAPFLIAIGWMAHKSQSEQVLGGKLDGQPDVVTRVIDGDTVDTQQHGRIRLCGIDAPEKSQAFGEQSQNTLKQLVEGKSVLLISVERDRYGRTVGELFVPTANPNQEIHINSEMVQRGMAYHYARYSGNCPNGGILERAEEMAKEQKVGVWSKPGQQKPWDYRKSQR